MQLLWELFRTFFVIGALTFGGGYAMLPMLEREIVNKHKWGTQEELLNYFAIGQCTSGIIAVNTATFVGYKKVGASGVNACVVALIASSVIKLVKSSIKQWWHIALAVAGFVVVAVFSLSPVYVVIACAVLSFIFGKKVQKA